MTIQQDLRIILDLEATCADQRNPEFNRDLSEIIEIGACLINADGSVLGTFQTFVKPIKTGNLTPFCTELTHIQQSDVDGAPDYQAALNLLDAWLDECNTKGTVKLWGSWGGYDYRQFMRNCTLLGAKPGAFLSLAHVNFKEVFAKQVLGMSNRKKMPGVGLALHKMKMTFEGTQHRAIDDAINIARLVKLIPTEKDV